MLVKFRDRVYAKSNGKLLVWDSSWTNFRPCEKIVWNPLTKEVEPFYGQYVSEIFDRNYGYGDLHDFCVEFTDKFVDRIASASEITDIDQFWRWTDQPLTWIGDRYVVVHPCTEMQNKEEYRRVFELRRKTFKRLPRTFRGTIKKRQL